MNKYAKISERFWLVVTAGLLIWVIIELIKNPVTDTLMLLVLPGLTGTMYFFRRVLRKRFEKNQ